MGNIISSYLLNIAYFGFLLLVSPVILYRMIFFGKYRDGFGEKFLGKAPELPVPKKVHKRIWFHAVSVGEVNLLRPLLEMIRERRRDWDIVISTTSNTGMELAKKLYGEHHTVFFCPLDFSWAVKNALKRIKPNMLVLSEQELWPNLVSISAQKGVKLAIVNARMGEGGYRRYKLIRFLMQRMLGKIDLIAAQSELYAGWFHQLGARGDSITVSGSMKFDGANTDRNNPKTKELAELAGITLEDTVFLSGSTQEPEEEMSLHVFQSLRECFPSLRLILVPRHPERFDSVAKMLDENDIKWERRSKIPENSHDPEARVLLVDTVGELGAWWGTSHIAFVGGSMGSRGGQNMIEPAAYGAAVSFGPNTKNFRDIVELMLRAESAIVVHDEKELYAFVENCLENPEYAKALGEKAKELVKRQYGATEITFEKIETLLQREPKY